MAFDTAYAAHATYHNVDGISRKVLGPAASSARTSPAQRDELKPRLEALARS